MSTHGAHGAEAHAFDGEATTELAEGEPRTPGWLPALGAALFLCAGVYALVGMKDEPAPARDVAAPPSAATAVAAPPPPSAPPPRPAVAAPAGPRPTGSAPRKLDPAEYEKLKKLVEQAKKRGGAPAPTAGHAP